MATAKTATKAETEVVSTDTMVVDNTTETAVEAATVREESYELVEGLTQVNYI